MISGVRIGPLIQVLDLLLNLIDLFDLGIVNEPPIIANMPLLSGLITRLFDLLLWYFLKIRIWKHINIILDKVKLWFRISFLAQNIIEICCNTGFIVGVRLDVAQVVGHALSLKV